MQVCCKFYGLTNASSVVESQGCWFANVVPENAHQVARRPWTSQRLCNGVREREALREWRERVTQLEYKLQTLHEERIHFGERLDDLAYARALDQGAG